MRQVAVPQDPQAQVSALAKFLPEARSCVCVRRNVSAPAQLEALRLPFAPAVRRPLCLQLRLWQLQQLQARHMVLDQQAKSAATATSKTQREVYVGGLAPGAVSRVP